MFRKILYCIEAVMIGVPIAFDSIPNIIGYIFIAVGVLGFILTVCYPYIFEKNKIQIDTDFDCNANQKKKLKRAVKKIDSLFLTYKNWGHSKEEVLQVSNYLSKASICADSDKAKTIFTDLNHSIGILISLKNDGYREGHQEIKDAKKEFEKHSKEMIELL